jgi:hypothetical protein
MSIVAVTCDKCMHRIKASPFAHSREVVCPRCKASVYVPAAVASPKAAAPPSPPLRPSRRPLRVVLVDVDMPFESMVGFILKWALAAIPAAIILAVVFAAVSAAVAATIAAVISSVSPPA